MMWSSQEILQATGGTLQGIPFTVNAVVIDSRKLRPGALFVALKGDRFDGHSFIARALEGGATAALVDHVPGGNAPGSYIIVKDVYAALLAMARAARARLHGKIIAVTGSVGKTGTKEALRVAAASGGKVYATQGNFNNHIGLPLTLCNVPRDIDYGIFELGMNHAGEISFLTHLAKPDVAIVTNVEAAHLEFFSGLEAIAAAKAEIMESMGPQSTIVLNRDNAAFAQLFAAAQKQGIGRIITFGEHESADCRLIQYVPEEGGAQIEARILEVPLHYHLGALGKHWAINSLASIAAVTVAGVDLANAAASLAHFHEPEGRGKLLRMPWRKEHITLMDDCYNANPASITSALAKLADVHHAMAPGGRKIVALGDMLELGETSPQLHHALLAPILAQGVDLVFAAGEMMKHLYDGLPDVLKGGYAANAAELAPLVARGIKPDDVVLIKGSRGSRMDIVRDALQNSAQTTSTKDNVNAL